MKPTFVCLLPARNCVGDLDDYFESVARFADAVVALDDGSTDTTYDRLAREPLVNILIRNSPRPTYAGWDDAANRNRLLHAAAALEPAWIISIDADERLDEADAGALRAFVERDALPGFAYGFRVVRMVGDGHGYDRDELWAYRLFAYAADQTFPDGALHLVPIPTSIPRSQWLRTTLRIQHYAGTSAAKRACRFAKYGEADPLNIFQSDYGHLLEPPEVVRWWRPRAHDLPVLLAPAVSRLAGQENAALDGPALSAIVIARNDERSIERAVASVVNQKVSEPFEVIVVTSGADNTATVVRRAFPSVTVIELEGEALPGRARNAGVRAARGEYVSFPGSHVHLPPGSLDARLRAHRLGYPLVTGTTLNGSNSWSGWASYFLDHSTVLPARPSEVLVGPPAHCSYLRDVLLSVDGFPEDRRAGEDTVVNVALTRRGYKAYRAAGVTIVHRSPCTSPWRLARHHFVRGRGLGRIVLDERQRPRRLRGYIVHYVPRRLARTTANVRRWGDRELRRRYALAFPLVTLGAAAAWLGFWYEVVSARLPLARLLSRVLRAPPAAP